MFKKIRKIINNISGYLYFKTLDIEGCRSTFSNADPMRLDTKDLFRGMKLLQSKHLPQDKIMLIPRDICRGLQYNINIEGIPRTMKDEERSEIIDKMMRRFLDDINGV